VDAQNAQIWTASVVIGIEPKSALIGGTARVLMASCVTQRHTGDCITSRLTFGVCRGQTSWNWGA
jgi:hypothetical protein